MEKIRVTKILVNGIKNQARESHNYELKAMCESWVKLRDALRKITHTRDDMACAHCLNAPCCCLDEAIDIAKKALKGEE